MPGSGVVPERRGDVLFDLAQAVEELPGRALFGYLYRRLGDVEHADIPIAFRQEIVHERGFAPPTSMIDAEKSGTTAWISKCNGECIEELTSKFAITGLHTSASFAYTWVHHAVLEKHGVLEKRCWKNYEVLEKTGHGLHCAMAAITRLWRSGHAILRPRPVDA